MISTELHRDVPQYMAIPWLITWVMALTVSAGTDGGRFRPGPDGVLTRPRPLNLSRPWRSWKGEVEHTYPRWVWWDLGDWQKPRQRSPAEASVATRGDLIG